MEKLFTIAKKESRRILGLMSGTSLDGLDLALCQIKGSGEKTSLTLEAFTTYPYTPTFRQAVNRIFAKPQVDMAQLCAMHVAIADKHAELVKRALSEWQVSEHAVDILASHGQTVFHAPRSLTGNIAYPNSTLQLGDGDHLAVKTGIITVSDFRQKHLAAGGEGAPLVVYGDNLLFTHQTDNRVLLNIGGIANFTYLPARCLNKDPIATDVGPGNTLMNQYMQAHFDLPYDKNGLKAAKGQINRQLLDTLCQHSFFDLDFPKTTGPELFNLTYLKAAQERSSTLALPHEDVLATLAVFTAHNIAAALRKLIPLQQPYQLFVSGGGYHNAYLMRQLHQALPEIAIEPLDKLGLNPDAKEAALFALLANETIAGNPTHMRGGAGAPAVCLGKISLPY